MHYLLIVALVGHAYYWGAGATLLVLRPGRRSLGWALAPGVGLALQSAVVWLGAVAGWGGTDSYAAWSELVPLLLLGLGLRKVGLTAIRAGARNLARFPAVAIASLMLCGGWMLVSPMAAAGKGITSSSLGSCDHADYAAGARVLAEFSRGSRQGMLGVRGVTEIPGAEFFYDYWLRLNHFTPSALIAHSASVFRLEAYRLVSVFGVALLLLNIPLVFLVSRVLARLSRVPALAVAALYTFSPLSAYAVHQGALAQILAAHGIALIGVCAGLIWWRGDRGLMPILAAAFWLLAGSYNFILAVCLAQVAMWLGGKFFVHRRVHALGRTVVALAVSFLVVAVLFWPRLAGIVERFLLLDRHDYGWPILLSAWDSWLGIVGSIQLAPVTCGELPWLGLVVGFGWLGGVMVAWRRMPSRGMGFIALVFPVACGWTILAWQSLERANASYDAFKLVSVFYPGMLAGLIGVLPVRSRAERIGSGVFVTALMLLNLISASEVRQTMSAPPLRVDKHLVRLQRIEVASQVGTVNVRIDQYWARLWANAFLLRKEHYFSVPTYEGRIVTPLRGDWDLTHSLLAVRPAGPEDEIDVGPNFSLVRRTAVSGVALGFGPDWHAIEWNQTDQWRWAKGVGTILIDNTTGRQMSVRVGLRLQGIREADEAEILHEGTVVARLSTSGVPRPFDPIALSLPPGRSRLIVRPASVGVRNTPGDTRPLGFALHGLRLQLLVAPASPR